MPFIDTFPDPAPPTSTTDRLNFIFDILPTELLDLSHFLWEPRLKVDGAEVQIMNEATISETEKEIGWTLNVDLLDPSDYSLFTATASIDFGFGQKIDDIWDETTFITLLSGGAVQSVSRSKSGPPSSPQDSVKVTIVSNGNDKLSKTSENGLIIYDSDRTQVSDADIKPIVDADGHSYSPEIIAIPGLKLSDLFQEVFITRCGFDWYRTDLPEDDYPIQRYEVKLGGRFFDGLAQFIGMYSPAITPTDDNGIWITDTTILQPEGFPAARRVTLDRPLSIDINSQRQRLDALLVNYAGLENNYDFTTARFENSDGSNGDVSYEYEKITIEFRKITSPTTNVIVREALNIENKTTLIDGFEIDQSSDVYEFDSKGRIDTHRKTAKKRLPTGTLLYDDFDLITVSEEKDKYSYAPHPFRPRTDIIERRVLNVTGLTAVISDVITSIDNSPLPMKADTAYRSGWITTTTTLEEVSYRGGVPIMLREETADPQKNGTCRVRVFAVDQLTGLVVSDYVEDRPGEVGISGQSTSSERLLVFAHTGASRSVDRVEDFSIGELPLKYGIPLARRVLKQRQADAGTVTIPVLAYDKSLKKGIPIVPVDRDDTDLGTYLIAGRTITINRNGLVMNLTGRVMAATDQQASEIERYARTIDESTSLTFTLPVSCLDGNTIGIDPSTVDNLTIEARHVEMPEAPLTNLSTRDIDLGEWDGTDQSFEIRVTAGEITGTDIVRESFALEIGPGAVPDIPLLLEHGHGVNHGSATLSFNASVPFGSNKILIVGVGNRNQGIPTGVTFNGVAMTAIASSISAIGTRISAWYLIDPPEGTFSLVATFGASQLDIDAVYTVFGNVNQTTPLSDHATAAAGGADPNLIISSFTGHLILDFVNKWGGANFDAPVQGANQTLIETNSNPDSTEQIIGASYSVNGDTSHMAWDLHQSVGFGANYSQIAIGINTVAQV